MSKRELFKVEGENIRRVRKHCPKCGPGVFLADHKNRLSCGKCGYTEFKGGGRKQQTPSLEKPKEEVKPEQKPEEKAKPETKTEETNKGEGKPEETKEQKEEDTTPDVKEESTTEEKEEPKKE